MTDDTKLTKLTKQEWQALRLEEISKELKSMPPYSALDSRYYDDWRDGRGSYHGRLLAERDKLEKEIYGVNGKPRADRRVPFKSNIINQQELCASLCVGEE